MTFFYVQTATAINDFSLSLIKTILGELQVLETYDNMNTPCLSTPVGAAWLTGENLTFQKNFRGERKQ